MSLEVTGKLEKFLEQSTGTTKDGKEWKKQPFIVKTDEDYNNLYPFELFASGEHLEKIDNLLKYNKVGDTIKVQFNVNANEYKGKYYTNLSAWRVDNSKQPESQSPAESVGEVEDDLPFN